MFILKFIEWLGQERDTSTESMWDADLLFVLVISAAVGAVFLVDMFI